MSQQQQPQLQPNLEEVPPTPPLTRAARSGHETAAGLPAPSGVANLRFGVAPTSAASEMALITRLVGMINDSYMADEGDLWHPRELFRRTDSVELQAAIEAGELTVAWTPAAAAGSHEGDEEGGRDLDDEPSASSVLGCMRTQWRTEQSGSNSAPGSGCSSTIPVFGMLVCDPSCRGTGVGRSLMRFGEEEARRRGAAVGQVELLMPREWTHPGKARLGAWYGRMGYVTVRLDRVEDHYPRLKALLAGPSDMRVMEKKL